MREILFRGKTKKGEWVEGFYYINRYRYAGCKDFIAENPNITTGITEASGAYSERVEEIEYEIIPETVGQYTGLTDKNGKKIFEGDICQTKGFPLIDDKPFVVEWNDDECSFYWRDVVGTDEFNIGVSQNTTIIGNIHDNPELLKGGAE